MKRIVDAHHHIWRRADLSWLNGPMQPRIFGPYEAICRDYLVDEFVQEASAAGVQASVYVQANWPTERYAEEAAWVQSVADESGWPTRIVAYADMMADDVRPQLDALSRHDRVCGVRMQLHWHDNTAYRFATTPDLCTHPRVQRNVNALADYGYSFDLQVFAPQMAGAAELAAACPHTVFVLQHAGMPEDLSDAGRDYWREQMGLLAVCPNIVTKLSAFGTFIHRNDAAHIASIVDDTVALFGAERCLFGSNFPIEKLWTDYAALMSAFLDATAHLPEPAREQIFAGTAERVYRF